MKVTGILAGAMAVAGLVAAPRASEAGALARVTVSVGHDDGYGYRNGYGYGNGYGYRDTYRLGYGRGYQEGLDHGAGDGRRNDDYNFRDDKRYRCGDSGYRSSYGPKPEYVSGYRAGYEQGYRRSFVGYRHRNGGRDGWGYAGRDRDDRDRHYGDGGRGGWNGGGDDYENR